MLVINLLGSPAVTLDGVPVEGFKSSKAQGLLYYLALNLEASSRESLATLLWPETTDQRALTNLRNTLANLYTLIGEPLLRTRQTAGLDRAAVDVDVYRQQRLLADLTAEGLRQRLQEAIALDRGELLAGFSIRDAEPFDSWATNMRSQIHAGQINLLMALAHRCADENDAETGLLAARRVLRKEPWHEEAAELVMALLIRRGQRTEAMDVYRQLAAQLDEEFGVQPRRELRERYHRLAAISRPIPTNLPGERDAFVGRRTESAVLCARLNNPDCRHVTLLGPGGVGKSRLALHVGHHFLHPQAHDLLFQDGVFLVMLERVHTGAREELHSDHSLTPTAAMMQEILTATGGTQRGERGLQEQLLQHLRDKEMLLVLDNFEHLLEATPKLAVSLLAKILAAAPSLKLLVTSRQRLNLKSEWLVTLDGLPLSTPSAERTSSDAELLFWERGRQIVPRLAAGPETRAAVSRICALLDGLPLAIEMAASWLRILTPADILEEIRRGMGILTSRAHDVDDRHRSMQVIFESSWQMLTEAEQKTLIRLSIFRGPFRRDAALAVADADLAMMLSLTDKSWLRRDGDQLFRQHEILRQFVETVRLDDGITDEAIRKTHAAYYATWTASLLARLHGEQVGAIHAIERERENIRIAWVWAIDNAELSLLTAMMEPFLYFFLATGQYTVGRDAFAATAAPFRQRLATNHVPDPSIQAEYRRFVAAVETLEATCLVSQGRKVDAHKVLAAAEPVLAETPEASARLLAQIRQLHGRMAFYADDPTPAVGYLQDAVRQAHAAGDPILAAMSGMFLATVQQFLGEDEEAMARIEKSLAVFHQADQPLGLGVSLIVRGLLEAKAGKVRAAERTLNESVLTLRVLGDNPFQADALTTLAALARKRSALKSALGHLLHAHTIADKAGTLQIHYRVLNELADLASAADRPDLAARIFWLLEQSPDFPQLALKRSLDPGDQSGPDSAAATHLDDRAFIRLLEGRPAGEMIADVFASLEKMLP